MDWGGIIAGALGGGAKAATDIADNQIAQNSKTELLNVQAQIEKDKLNYAEQLRREGVLYEATGEGGDAKRKALGLNAIAQSKAEVEGASAKLDAASAAGLPGKEAGYARAQFDANKQLTTEKANRAATDAAGAAVAADKTPGYIAALKNKAMAEGAAHLQVANAQLSQALTMAKKPEVVTDSEGNINLRSWDPKTNKVETKPLLGADGKPMKGPKDLDQRTLKMVDALLVDAKAELDPEKRQAAVQSALLLLKPKQAESTGDASGKTWPAPPAGAIADLKKDPDTKVKFDAVFGPGAADKVLGGAPKDTGAATAPASGGSPATPQEKAAADKLAADRKQKQEWDAEAKRRDEARQGQLKSEVSGLTLDQIQALSPKRAQQILSQYGAALSPDQRRALNKQL